MLAVGLGLAVLALLVLFAWPSCPLLAVFERRCPTCGMVAAVHLAFAGELHASLAAHPLALPTSLLSLGFAAAALRAAALGSVAAVWHTRAARLLVAASLLVVLALAARWALTGFGA